jgi:putative glycosyltransferase
MQLSIVTTLYRSAAHIREFHQRMTAVASRVTNDYEMVMVDDGSPDESLALACEIAAVDPHVRVVELSRNFGHHRAMMAGLRVARGELVFLLDVDLEEEPEWLERFAKVLHEGRHDVVYGYQIERKGRLLERLGGAFHWWVIRRLSYYPIPENLVTARLMRRRYVRALIRHREQNTAIGGLWAMTGFDQAGIAVVKGHRGATSYSVTRRLVMGFEGITSFSEKPLVLVLVLGLVIFAVSSFGAAYLIIRRLTGTMESGWASLIVSVWMLGGLSIACIGVLGLYTARIFVETKRRPYVIIRHIHQRGA